MPRNTYTMAKLVRDEAVATMEQGGATVDWQPLTGPDLIRACLAKLVEEATEAQDTQTPDELAEECADMLELIHTLLPHMGLTMAQLEALRQQKAGKRGSFSKGLYVAQIHCTPGSFWDGYCKKDPQKYPQSQD